MHKAQYKQPPQKQDDRPGRIKEVRNLEVWGRAPVRLAGCDDEPTEPHIFRGID